MRGSLLAIFSPPFYSPHAFFLIQGSLIVVWARPGKAILLPSLSLISCPHQEKQSIIRNMIGPINGSNHYASHLRIREWIVRLSLSSTGVMPYASIGTAFNQPLFLFIFFSHEASRSELRSEIQVWPCDRKRPLRTLGQAAQSCSVYQSLP